MTSNKQERNKVKASGEVKNDNKVSGDVTNDKNKSTLEKGHTRFKYTGEAQLIGHRWEQFGARQKITREERTHQGRK